ncbi:MAG: LysR family transcriptional regulator [Raoultibacter sp.]
MELLQLQYFAEVAESEHVTNSAKKLHIAQPALTQSIHRLEDELGVTLFEHTGRNIRLSSAGAYLKERIKPALATLDALQNELVAFSAQEDRTIRINIRAASGIVIDAITAYSAKRPDARFQIIQSDTEETYDIDVMTLSPTDGDCNPALDRIRKIDENTFAYKELIYLAVPQNSSYPETGVPLSKLSNENFICLAGSHRFREICDTLCARQGFTQRVTFESDNPSVVTKMIGLGLGVGFWPEHSWSDLEERNARLVRLQEVNFERTIIVSFSAKKAPAEADTFFRFFIAYLETLWNA